MEEKRSRHCSLINRQAVREFALSQDRRKMFTRVGESFLDELEAAFRRVITAKVASHPSVGKTLLGDYRPSRKQQKED